MIPNGASFPDMSGIQFLRAELDTGLTFSRVAETTAHEDKRRRNCAHARKAYDTVLHFLPNSSLDNGEMNEVKTKLEELRFALQSLGEKL